MNCKAAGSPLCGLESWQGVVQVWQAADQPQIVRVDEYLPYRRAAEIAAAPDPGQLPWLTLHALRVSRQCDLQCHTTCHALAPGCWHLQQLRLQGHDFILRRACLAQDKISKIRSNFYFELQFILRPIVASTPDAAQATLKWPKLRTVAELLQVPTALGWIWLVLDE